MLKIYGSDLSSPACKVRFVAHYLDIKYDYITVNLRDGEQHRPEFLKINPVGKVPSINDDGFYLFESNAICRYLADKKGSSVYPRGLKERAQVDQWLDFGSMHVAASVSKVIYNRIFAPIRKVEVDERSIKEGLEFLARFLPVVDRQLATNVFLLGTSITLADFNILAGLDPVEAARIDIGNYSNICRWRNELKKQDFYTRCHKEYGESLKQSVR